MNQQPLRFELVQPDAKYKISFLSALAEMQSDSDKQAWVYLGDQQSVEIAVKNFELYVNKLILTETKALPGLVRNKIYWAVSEGEVIGRIALRFELNDFLKKIGGHIGYIVRPSYKKKGVATEMLRKLLQTEKAKEIGHLLLTCDDGNTASEKTILNNGGIFEGYAIQESENQNNAKQNSAIQKKRFWIKV